MYKRYRLKVQLNLYSHAIALSPFEAVYDPFILYTSCAGLQGIGASPSTHWMSSLHYKQSKSDAVILSSEEKMAVLFFACSFGTLCPILETGSCRTVLYSCERDTTCHVVYNRCNVDLLNHHTVGHLSTKEQSEDFILHVLQILHLVMIELPFVVLSLC